MLQLRHDQPVHPRAGGERVHPVFAFPPSDGSSPRGRGTHGFELVALDELRFIPARAGNATASFRSATASPVHPRAGGERRPPRRQVLPSTGSSPRGRGTPLQRGILLCEGRFIPARAGNARDACSASGTRSVHPRAGGERVFSVHDHAAAAGSSPRGRGTRRGQRRGRPQLRFIPARAGNAAARCPRPTPRSVHPRAGGERPELQAGSQWLDGSSPRGRGTRGEQLLDARVARFIPARAGNACRAWCAGFSPSVHPRAGGERPDTGHLTIEGDGSSPRGRGTPRGAEREAARRRFIPARAGNAYFMHFCSSVRSVHPRAGGERSVSNAVERDNTGSSPRGRGTLGDRLAPRGSVRFIPARAGNATGSPTAPRATTVHPRAGGERNANRERINPPYGSSPRGRGTLPYTRVYPEHLRFIPARAGNAR